MRKKKTQEEGKQRKRWGSPEKLRIVLAGLEPGVEISDLCRREGVSPALYYQWKRRLLGAAERIFEKKEHKPSAREEQFVFGGAGQSARREIVDEPQREFTASHRV